MLPSWRHEQANLAMHKNEMREPSLQKQVHTDEMASDAMATNLPFSHNKK